MSKKINYVEGDVFFVPLRNGSFARGVIARLDGKGSIFGHFFGPKITRIDDVFVTDELCPDNAILIGHFGDLGLLNGEWKTAGAISNWLRGTWVMPPFLRTDDSDDIGFITTYDENTLKCISEVRVKLSEIDEEKYPQDGSMGYGYVEVTLTEILAR